MLQIEPDAKIVQSYFRNQTSLKTEHDMWAFASKAKGLPFTVSIFCFRLTYQRCKPLGQH